ncbi:MAG TPA: tetraacyldisaccharide 4'-kinase [Noviherbaspirillum sp.]
MTRSAERVLADAWRKRGVLAWSLWPVSLLFRALVAVRRALYRIGLLATERMPVPVVVVGNVYVGGTGKTPFVIWLADELRRAGYVPGIISRGYGASGDAPLEVMPDSAPQQVGDEPALIALRTGCPVMVGRDRVGVARALLATHPEVNILISDDGLQHYRLARDVEIVLCDDRGNGNGWMLPAGPLREPASRRRDFTVVNAGAIPDNVPPDTVQMRLAGDTAFRLSDRSLTVSLSELGAKAHGSRVLAAAGIGNPARFFSMLRGAGLTVEEMPLPDHFDYAVNPFAGISADIILITEKDAVKCARTDTINNDPRIWVVPVAARIDHALTGRIVEKCRGRPTA